MMMFAAMDLEFLLEYYLMFFLYNRYLDTFSMEIKVGSFLQHPFQAAAPEGLQTRATRTAPPGQGPQARAPWPGPQARAPRPGPPDQGLQTRASRPGPPGQDPTPTLSGQAPRPGPPSHDENVQPSIPRSTMSHNENVQNYHVQQSKCPKRKCPTRQNQLKCCSTFDVRRSTDEHWCLLVKK